MAVTFGSTATSSSVPNGTTMTFACTTVASDNRLLVMAGKTVGGAAPTGITYNGVALTGLPPAAQGFNLSVWYLDNPPAGTFNVIVSWAATAQLAAIAIPLTGVDTARAPVLGTATTGSGTAASCSVSGAGANDLQIAMAMVVSTTLSSAGAPQSVVTSVPTMPILSINAAYSYSADFVTLGSAGNFAWTLTSGTWNGLGVTVFAPTGGGGGTLKGPVGGMFGIGNMGHRQ